jgi:hypothetical protein
MTPECPKCASTSARRRSRSKSLKHQLMFLLGRFPWECLNCQRHFFSTIRYSRSRRHAQGEVYVGSKPAASVAPGTLERHT